MCCVCFGTCSHTGEHTYCVQHSYGYRMICGEAKEIDEVAMARLQERERAARIARVHKKEHITRFKSIADHQEFIFRERLNKEIEAIAQKIEADIEG